MNLYIYMYVHVYAAVHAYFITTHTYTTYMFYLK